MGNRLALGLLLVVVCGCTPSADGGGAPLVGAAGTGGAGGSASSVKAAAAGEAGQVGQAGAAEVSGEAGGGVDGTAAAGAGSGGIGSAAGDAAGGSAGACSQGDTRACTGPGACSGGQLCGSDQAWGVCDCGISTGGFGGSAGRGGAGGLGGVGGGSAGAGGGTTCYDSAESALCSGTFHYHWCVTGSAVSSIKYTAGDGTVFTCENSSTSSCASAVLALEQHLGCPGAGGAGGSGGGGTGGNGGAAGAADPLACSPNSCGHSGYCYTNTCRTYVPTLNSGSAICPSNKVDCYTGTDPEPSAVFCAVDETHPLACAGTMNSCPFTRCVTCQNGWANCDGSDSSQCETYTGATGICP